VSTATEIAKVHAAIAELGGAVGRIGEKLDAVVETIGRVESKLDRVAATAGGADWRQRGGEAA
jgi:hypothetical protein